MSPPPPSANPGDLPERERLFHDAWAEGIDVNQLDVHRAFEGVTAPENRFILQHLGDLRGRRLLDLGCGAGESTVYFALQGALCTAQDLSPGMLDTTRRLAQRYHVTVDTIAGDAARLPFPDATFDIVYAANFLHHVQPLDQLREIHRLLKPGGLCATWDPLRHNPVINLYRRMATQVRTPDEQPLSIHILRNFRELFSTVQHDTFWYATLWIFLRFYLIERVHPNQERYWKKIIAEEPRLRPTYLRLARWDRLIKRLPGCARLAWNLAVVARK